MALLIPIAMWGINSATFAFPSRNWLQHWHGISEQAHKEASSIDLIFDGASITEGFQSTGKEVWNERYGKLHAFNFGVSGDHTQNVLWRLSRGQVDGLHPRLVAIMVGLNNLRANTPEEIAEGLKAIVAQYRERCPDAVILLQALLPAGEKPADPLRDKIKAVNALISKQGDGKKVIVVNFGDKFLNPDGTISPEIMPDFEHPSLKGYRIWADAIQPVINTCFPEKQLAK